jgi:hypothetical protein
MSAEESENTWFAGSFLIEKVPCAGSARSVARRVGSNRIRAVWTRVRNAEDCSVFTPPYSTIGNNFQGYCLSILFELDATVWHSKRLCRSSGT